MKPKHLGILLLCAVFWTVGIAAFVYTTYKLEQVIPYNAKFSVSEKEVGLSTVSNELDFGMAPKGGTAKRYVYVENTQDSPREYSFLIEGEISSFVRTDPQTFILAPGETKQVEIIAAAPADAALGEYGGTISLLIEKP